MLEKLLDYLALLHKWNAVYNLTAIREESRMLTHHLLDALSVERLLARVREAGMSVDDIEIRKADLEDVFLDVMSGASATTAPMAPMPPTEEVQA